MTTNMPDDPKLQAATNKAKVIGSARFTRYATALPPSAKPAVLSPVLPVASVQLRSTTPPTSYINPERLMDDVGELYAAHERVFKSLDALDAAARYAGTPIRSGSPRERFTHLFGVIREVETTARKAWQDELIAAGGTSRPLRLALEKAAKNDALYVTKLLSKDGTSDGHKATDPDRMPVTPSLEHEDPFDEAMPNALTLTTGVPAKQVRSSKQFGYNLPPFGYELGLAAEVHNLLKDGGFGTDRLTHGELLKLVALFKGASAQSATATIMSLTDRELRLIADDMDSSGLGNYAGLSSSQKESFIAKLATQLDSTQFVRIAKAFDDDVQIAQVLARTAGTQHLAAPFIAYCEAKFSGGSYERKASTALAAAITVADMSTNDLANLLTTHSETSTFLTEVFRAATGHTVESKRIDSFEIPGSNARKTVHHFETTLLTKINQTAAHMTPAQEGARFTVFQRTIDTLEWVNNHPPYRDSTESIKQALLSTTELLENGLETHLAIHSAQQPTYVEWVKQLLKSGESKKVADLVATATGISKDKWWWAGYMVAIVDRASTIIENEDNAVIGLVDLAADIASAILNGAKLAAQIAGETIKSIASFIRSNASEGMNLAALIEISIAQELEGESGRTSREQYILGKGDGSLGVRKL
jgi:hypothetical protein